MSSQVSVAPARVTQPAQQGGGAVSTGRDARQHQIAWQREMERAQLTSWFKTNPVAGENAEPPPESRTAAHAAAHRHGGERRGSAPPGASRRDPFPAVPASRTSNAGHMSAASTAPWVSSGPMSMRAAPSKTLRPAEGPQRPEAYQPSPMTGLPANVRRAFPASITESASRAQPSMQIMEPSALLRLHPEERPEGHAVWIAMRANDEALRAMLPGIVADLQRALRDRGERLHLVVCNGQPVWRDGVALIPQDNPHDQLHPREA